MIAIFFFFMTLHNGVAQPDCYVDTTMTVTSNTMRIQEATFRLLQGTVYRLWQNQTWCKEEPTVNGRPYNFTEAKAMILSLLDLEMLLQFDETCIPNLWKLRQMLTNLSVAPGKSDEWWRSTWYNTSLEAFSCGFIPASSYSFVPYDLKANIKGNVVLQKTWRLVQDFIWSSYKMREYSKRREDYDVSLYIPFIDHLVNTPYLIDSEMRVGYPYYIGTTNWFLFHTVAQRIADLEQKINSCNKDGVTLLLDRFKNMFLGFVQSGQPCPACREHFLSSVSNNDRFAESYNKSEAYHYYPIEWLILGSDDGTFESKFASISSPKELVLFLWKLHNAVSSSVNGSVECLTEEQHDGKNTDYQCSNKNVPQTHRLWPVSMRFEFSMRNFSMWDWSRSALLGASYYINTQDTANLRRNLWQVWNANGVPDNDTQNTLSSMQASIATLENILWNGGMFASQYSISTAWDCTNFNSTLENVTEINPPVMSTYWNPIPAVCVENVVKSISHKTMSKTGLSILAVVLIFVTVW